MLNAHDMADDSKIAKSMNYQTVPGSDEQRRPPRFCLSSTKPEEQQLAIWFGKFRNGVCLEIHWDGSWYWKLAEGSSRAFSSPFSLPHSSFSQRFAMDSK